MWVVFTEDIFKELKGFLALQCLKVYRFVNELLVSLELYCEVPLPFWWVEYSIVQFVSLDLQNCEI